MKKDNLGLAGHFENDHNRQGARFGQSCPLYVDTTLLEEVKNENTFH
jgi:hypothetical protein